MQVELRLREEFVVGPSASGRTLAASSVRCPRMSLLLPFRRREVVAVDAREEVVVFGFLMGPYLWSGSCFLSTWWPS